MELPAPVRRLVSAWDHLWFAPVDARSLGAMRVSLGLLLLWWWAWLLPELGVLFGPESVADPILLDSKRSPYAISPLDGAPVETLRWVWGGGLVVIAAYTVGLGTPVVRFLVPALLVSVYHLNPWAWNGGDRLIRIWTVLMALTPCGAAWSVDAWLRGRWGRAPRRTVPAWGHRLVQLQLVVMYTWTGIAKLESRPWRDGTAITWSVLDGAFNRAPWLLDAVVLSRPGLWAGALLVAFTLVFEVGFGPLVLWRRTRPWTLLAGVALHAGIFVTMSVGMFGPASVWGYQAFYPSWPRRLDGGEDG